MVGMRDTSPWGRFMQSGKKIEFGFARALPGYVGVASMSDYMSHGGLGTGVVFGSDGKLVETNVGCWSGDTWHDLSVQECAEKLKGPSFGISSSSHLKLGPERKSTGPAISGLIGVEFWKILNMT